MKVFTTPGGEQLVVLTREEYENLIDARDHAISMRDVAAGRLETIPAADIDRARASPVAYWRKRRSMTQATLAAEVGVSQAYVAQIEGGHRTGDVHLYMGIAHALGVRIEDLVCATA